MTVVSAAGIEWVLGRLDSEPIMTAFLGFTFLLIAHGIRRLNAVPSSTEQPRPIRTTQFRPRPASDLRLNNLPSPGIEIPEHVSLS